MSKKVRLQRLERIFEISRELTSTVSLEPLLHRIVKVAAELSGSQAASILLLDARTGELRFRAADDDPAGQLRDIPVPVGNSIQVEDHMTRRHGGVGLGLSTVKGLVELHGGRVWAESVPDRGSRFVVLPASPP